MLQPLEIQDDPGFTLDFAAVDGAMACHGPSFDPKSFLALRMQPKPTSWGDQQFGGHWDERTMSISVVTSLEEKWHIDGIRCALNDRVAHHQVPSV